MTKMINFSFVITVLSMLSFPTKSHFLSITIWATLLPIYVLFLVTIPDCNRKRFKNWFPLTFTMCIVWIGSLSYFVAWMITVVGEWRLHSFAKNFVLA